ncbi:MAG: chromate transporter [Anaerovoracaceae bacterium]|nr:chromate transporter [Anaerovoracaceae bacterium]
MEDSTSEKNKKTSFRDLLKLFVIFFRIGLFTIGGGMAMIPVVEDIAVNKYKWYTEEEVIDVIAVCQALPGVIAINMATYIGSERRGIAGALAATIGVIMPSYIIISAIVILLGQIPDNRYVEGMFTGMKACAAGLIAVAAWNIARKTVKDAFTAIIAAVVFIAIAFFDVNAVLGVLFGAACGLIAMAVKNSKAAGKETKRNGGKDEISGGPGDKGGDGDVH